MKNIENPIKKKLTISAEKIVSPTVARLAKLAGYDWNSIEFANGATLSFGKCYKQDYNGQWKIIQPKAYNPKNPHIPAMSQSLLQKWIREVHNIHIEVSCVFYSYSQSQVWSVRMSEIPSCQKIQVEYYYLKDVDNENQEIFELSSYEEALEVGLKEALKWIILKENYENNIPTKNILDGNNTAES